MLRLLELWIWLCTSPFRVDIPELFICLGYVREGDQGCTETTGCSVLQISAHSVYARFGLQISPSWVGMLGKLHEGSPRLWRYNKAKLYLHSSLCCYKESEISFNQERYI